MMKLYKIIVLHSGPKDNHTAIENYLIAKDDEEVLEWINENKKSHWWDWNEHEEDLRIYGMPFRDWLLENKGDLEDEQGWDSAYYGVTKWGWEEVENTSETDMEVLVRLGIAMAVDYESRTGKISH